MFNPFDSPSGEIFQQRRFTDAINDQRSAETDVMGSAIQQGGYVSAAKRARKYAKKQRQKAAASAASGPSTGAQIAMGLGSVAVGAGVKAGVTALL
jgi:hypothetical protein